MKTRTLTTIALLLATQAASAGPAPSDCAAIAADAERLACYDRTFGRKAATPAAPPAAPTPAPAAAPAADFGAETIPPPPIEDADVDELHARLPGRHEEFKRGQLLTLDNGQVWKCLEGRELLPAAEDAEIVIEKSLFGSYFLRLARGGAGTRVKRVK